MSLSCSDLLIIVSMFESAKALFVFESASYCAFTAASFKKVSFVIFAPKLFKSFSKASLIDHSVGLMFWYVVPSIALFKVVIIPLYSFGVTKSSIDSMYLKNNAKGSPVPCNLASSFILIGSAPDLA